MSIAGRITIGGSPSFEGLAGRLKRCYGLVRC